MHRPGRGRQKVLLHSHQAGALDRSSILIPFHHTATASDPKKNKATAGREEQVQYTAFSLPNPSLDIYVSSTLHLPSQSPKQIRLTSSQVQPLLAFHMASINAQFPTFLKVFFFQVAHRLLSEHGNHAWVCRLGEREIAEAS